MATEIPQQASNCRFHVGFDVHFWRGLDPEQDFRLEANVEFMILMGVKVRG